MLPNRDKNNRAIPITIDNSSSDLSQAAALRCMARMINAIQEQNASKALDAFKDLFALADMLEDQQEPEELGEY